MPYPCWTFEAIATSFGSSVLAATAASDWFVVRRDTSTTVGAPAAAGVVLASSAQRGSRVVRRRNIARRLAPASDTLDTRTHVRYRVRNVSRPLLPRIGAMPRWARAMHERR